MFKTQGYAMLRTVHLYDELADKFGPIYKFEISSPSEAIRALNANVPGFLRSIKRDGQYALVVGKDLKGRSIADKFELNYSLMDHENDIHLVPVIDGCGGGNKGFFSVILGVVLVATAFVMPETVPLIGSLTLSATTVGLVGATMVLGGISSMLTSPVASDPIQSENVESRPSFMFNSVENRAEQGGALPLIYGGPLMVGSIVVATGVTILQTGSDQPTPDENPGTVPTSGVLTITVRHGIFFGSRRTPLPSQQYTIGKGFSYTHTAKKYILAWSWKNGTYTTWVDPDSGDTYSLPYGAGDGYGPSGYVYETSHTWTFSDSDATANIALEIQELT